MAGEVQQVLQGLGPSMSSVVAAKLEQTYRLAPAAARARVSQGRLIAPVLRLDLPFPRGASFLYLENQFGTTAFWDSLGLALESSNGAYARAIWALKTRGGLMPVLHFDAAAATSEAAGQLSGKDVRDRLTQAGLLSELDVPGAGACIGFKRTAYNEEPAIRMRARLLAEEVLLQAVHSWAQNLNFGSYGAFAFRHENTPPKVGRFAWDMTAPSYLAPLKIWNQQANTVRPGFLAVDVLMERIDEKAARPYIYKLETLQRMRNMGRVLQFVVADFFTPEAFHELRRRGIVAATTEALFGKDVAEGLNKLLQILSSTAQSAADPAKFLQVMNALSKLEGAQGTLRGCLFEFISAAIARKAMGAQSVVMNRIYREGGRDVAEVDVRADCGTDLYFIECKGLLPGNTLSDEEVKAWLSKRIPVVRRKTLENEEFKNKRLHFELWITGELTDESKQRIATLQAQLRPTTYTVRVRYGAELLTMAQNTGDPMLASSLTQHFIEHPLALAHEDITSPPFNSEQSQAIAVVPDSSLVVAPAMAMAQMPAASSET